jgi:hypothetical protein
MVLYKFILVRFVTTMFEYWYACDVKIVGVCISGLVFMWGILFDPAFGGYRDITRQAKGLHRLKYVGALESGLVYLSRCNSGWFCHNVKYDGDCISGLAFVWGTLFDPASVVYRDVTRQAKELYRLKYVGALRSGLAYLSPCNSG